MSRQNIISLVFTVALLAVFIALTMGLAARVRPQIEEIGLRDSFSGEGATPGQGAGSLIISTYPEPNSLFMGHL